MTPEHADLLLKKAHIKGRPLTARQVEVFTAIRDGKPPGAAGLKVAPIGGNRPPMPPSAAEELAGRGERLF